MGRKRVKLEDEKEDRINDLPDPIIHHILSFLPSTLEAIRTGILSKRWKNQWTQVPVLIFNCFTSSGKSIENFLQNVDNTLILHDCLKIKKFHLEYYNYSSVKDPQLTSTIRFATAKHVEDLSLSLPQIPPLYMLPEFPLNKASLVKLRITGCTFPPPKGKENNWLCLTTLSLKCCALTDQVIAHVLLSGCPLLESLEVASCYGFREIVIASKSLKKFVLEGAYMCYIYRLQISCPKLEELSLKEIYTNVPRLIPQAIENILSVSLLLKSIDLFDCGRMLDQFVIASKSLKRLALGGHKNSDVFEIEISCPNLEELKMFGYLEVKTAKLDLPSSLCAIIDFDHVGELQTTKSLIMELLQQLHHVNELKIGCDQFIEILSTIKTRPLFSLVLNIKCLTLNSPRYQKHHCGIARLLRISPVLEKLVINVQRFKCSYKLRNNYWSSNEIVFDCLVAHLKIIRIVGFGFTERDAKCQHLLNFVQFLLKHAKVLEKMVVVVKDDGKGSPLQVCQELLSFPRCSKNAVIEVLNSN